MVADVFGWRDVLVKESPRSGYERKKRLEFGVGFLCEMELSARANCSGALTWACGQEWILSFFTAKSVMVQIT